MHGNPALSLVFYSCGLRTFTVVQCEGDVGSRVHLHGSDGWRTTGYKLEDGQAVTARSVIFAAFKESMASNLVQRSFKVIHFGGNLKSMYDFI